MATGREWKSEKWWIALPIATRTIDRYPLGPRGQGVGTSPGAAYTRAWAGVRGGQPTTTPPGPPGGPIIAARCPERATQLPLSACSWKERNGPKIRFVSCMEFSKKAAR
jgi:hypothetical protein